MKIAVLSGKGGTGKTFLSVNLACTEGNSVYVDCDIEEPNGHLFLKPDWQNEKSINVSLPDFNMEACTGCRKCVDFCKFNALVYIKNKIFLFDEVCHSCGGCQILCPAEAVGEKEKEVGRPEWRCENYFRHAKCGRDDRNADYRSDDGGYQRRGQDGDYRLSAGKCVHRYGQHKRRGLLYFGGRANYFWKSQSRNGI